MFTEGVREEEEGRLQEEFRKACDMRIVLIMGNFNLPGYIGSMNRKWAEQMRIFPSSSPGLLFNPVCEKPTRGSTALDLLFSNDPYMVEEVEVGSI